ATASDDKTARVWTDLTPLCGVEDPKLWAATTYCMSIERRIELLSVSEATARAEQQACQRRVVAAATASAGLKGGNEHDCVTGLRWARKRGWSGVRRFPEQAGRGGRAGSAAANVRGRAQW